VNMVVTNVPGPQVPFYTGGAQLLEVWPYVPVYHTLGLTVALVSYNGDVHFGLTADRDLVPDVDRLAKHMDRATSEFQAIARRLRRPFTRRSRKTGAAPVARSLPAGGAPSRRRRGCRPARGGCCPPNRTRRLPGYPPASGRCRPSVSRSTSAACLWVPQGRRGKDAPLPPSART